MGLAAAEEVVFSDVALFFGLLIAIWVGRDARSKQVPMSASKPYSAKNGDKGWFFVCLLLGIIGLVLYLVQRSATLSERTLAATPVAAVGSSKYCAKCGQRLPVEAGFCSRCGQVAR